MKKFLAGCWLAFLPLTLLAQATPAGAYWQQEVNYSIDVSLDDRQHMLTAQEEIQYTNNSPDQLTFIWFHLWPNAYKDNNTAFAKQQLRSGSREFQFAPQDQRGFIDQLDFKVNGQAATLTYDPEHADMAKLLLPQPLAAGGKITITTPFRVKIPASFSRFGHVEQSYQITQWYPKPAVYDSRGWHPMPYLDQGEFYSEFGSFDVRITLPANYTVGATGVLQNAEEQARLNQLATASASKKAEDYGQALTFPASAPETKTLRYVQDRVHDFAWFADKRFNVLKSNVVLPSGRQVDTWVMFLNKDVNEWIKGLQDVNDAITYYSQWVGEYPYSAATAVDGALSAGSGMEYPMVTVTMPAAIVHEVGHNWFYGILGSNERAYPWLDEGVNSYVENRVTELREPDSGQFSQLLKPGRISAALGTDGLTSDALNQVPYQAVASRGLDQPVSGPSAAEYGNLNYGLIVYGKTAALLKYLAGYLGQEKFDAAMRAYYQRWQFKHPDPADMQAAFEESTSQALGWFFQDMLQSTTRYNAAVGEVELTNTKVKVLVRNDSSAPFAVPVATLDAQGKVLETQWTPVFGENEEETQLDFRRKGVAAVVVDPTYLTLQLNRRDDQLKLAGTFPRLEPIRFRPLASIERWDQTAINWVPVIGANTSDKFMLGAAFYSNPLVVKRLNYLAMPMYSFNRNELNGIGTLSVNILPKAIARQLVTSLTVQRFERYVKVEPSLTLTLPKSAFNGPQHTLQIANTTVRNEDLRQSDNNGDVTTSIQTLLYHVRGGDALQSWSANVELNRLTPDLSVDNSSVQATLLRASASYSRFYSPKKQVQARLFGGRFLQKDNNSQFLIGLSGSPDYRRQTAFLDRQQISDAFTAQLHQTDDRDGAFKGFVPVFSRRWLSTLNLQANLPVTPLSVFADFGLTKEDNVLFGSRGTQNVFYDAGLVVPITLPLIKNIIQFYLPVAGSQYENGLPSSRKDFTDRIRFVLRLNQLSPSRFLDAQLAN